MASKRILVIDDEESYTNLFKMVLEETGRYEVRVENDSASARDTARDFEPDLIVLDVIMPGMSGLQVATLFREDKMLSKTPIIFLTATASRSHPAESNELLREHMVLAKPVTVAQLEEAIETTLGV